MNRRLSVSLLGLGLVSLLFATLSAAPVSAEPYGWSPDVNSGSNKTSVCTGEKPKAPILYQPNHPLLPKAKGAGQIRLQWTKVAGASGYNLFYGLTPKNYIYSVTGLTGDSDWYTIGGLGNRTYYFAIQAKKGCQSGPMSNEWGGRPGGAVVTAMKTMAAKPTVSYTPKSVTTPGQPKVVTPAPAPKVTPAPVAPKPTAPVAPVPQSKSWFDGIASFFSSLFK